MTITIYVRESDLESLVKFLTTEISLNHSIIFYLDKTLLSFTVVGVQITYDQYVRLKDWQNQN